MKVERFAHDLRRLALTQTEGVTHGLRDERIRRGDVKRVAAALKDGERQRPNARADDGRTRVAGAIFPPPARP